MNAKVEQTTGNSSSDIAKLGLAGLIAVAALVGFYYFAGQWSTAVRVVGLLAGFVLAIVVGAGTHSGRALREYIAESQFELRKVVWPTRDGDPAHHRRIIVVVIISTCWASSTSC